MQDSCGHQAGCKSTHRALTADIAKTEQAAPARCRELVRHMLQARVNATEKL